jgi:phosphate-selective porin OprO/OprP
MPPFWVFFGTGIASKEGASMALATRSTKIAIAVVMTLVGSQVRAQSASSTEAEIAALKKQLRLMEEKLDRLQKQTAVKTVAAAKANAKTEANAKVSVDANGVVPVKAPAAPPDAVVHMPNNRPTVCTADEQNCIALTSRLLMPAVTTIVRTLRQPCHSASTTVSMRAAPALA